MNRWTVQQEWGRIESSVTGGGINDKNQIESMEEVRKAAFAFVLAVMK